MAVRICPWMGGMTQGAINRRRWSFVIGRGSADERLTMNDERRLYVC
ncbi:MAG: hypothetical protein GQ550_02840 [Gammaproteobacteria bacterium]|nr:hypothetical protein [Gammaproteobacteria bacterium]